ncbi:MAG: extracellular solute-binding protein, partial [Selenomonadaceae bacterium]|nr:extracellular solute-binding protein [Selenomonadaceae bacterium]
TDKIQTLPDSWEEIVTNPVYKNSFGIADPALSGTSFMSIALLEKQFGWDYIVRLRQNGATKSKGSGQVVDSTASGELNACLGVDYIAKSKIDKGAHITMIYPKELLMVPSPIAIFKNSPNADNAKAFVDYVLSEEAQEKVAEAGTVPVRKKVKLPKGCSLPTPEEAMERGIKVNYVEVLAKKDKIISKFSELFKNV